MYLGIFEVNVRYIEKMNHLFTYFYEIDKFECFLTRDVFKKSLKKICEGLSKRGIS